MHRKSTSVIGSKLKGSEKDTEVKEFDESDEVEINEEDSKSLENLEMFGRIINETRSTITKSYTDEAINPTGFIESKLLGIEIEKNRVQYQYKRDDIMVSLSQLIVKDRDDADEKGTRGRDRHRITIDPPYHPIDTRETELRKRGIEVLLTAHDIQEKKYGNCHEYAALTLYKLYQSGFTGTAELYQVPGHAFVVVNKNPEASDDDVQNWQMKDKDKPCYILDSWNNRLIPLEKISSELDNYKVLSKNKSNTYARQNFNFKALEVAHKDLHYYDPKLCEELLPERSLHPSRVIHTPTREEYLKQIEEKSDNSSEQKSSIKRNI